MCAYKDILRLFISLWDYSTRIYMRIEFIKIGLDMRKLTLLFFLILISITSSLVAQDHSIAREWNEELLNGIRNDFARPTVHARNLWHSSIAIYDIWAIYDEVAEPFLCGQEVAGFTSSFVGIPESATPEEDMHEAMSYAMYRLMINRFNGAPGAGLIFSSINNKMAEHGYPINNNSRNYQTGDPAALGNYIADQVIAFGFQDNSQQSVGYRNRVYRPVNESLLIEVPGSQNMVDPNRWQPLTLELFIDQAGNPIPFNTPEFLSPEWGQVTPFALSEDDLTIYNRDAFDYYVYHDPGPPPYISTNQNDPMSQAYKWGFALVSIWASHLDPEDPTMIDASPRGIGNVPVLPDGLADYPSFYDFIDGGDASQGRMMNPVTNQPYEPQMVKRGDYARILAEFWADGPDSETPPGHWFSILNEVNDHPMATRKYRGAGEDIDELEWDVKSYFMLGSAMHDCAISAWGIKGWYDYLRPVSAIRYMADQGQSSDPTLDNYDVRGIPLVPEYIEVVEAGDDLEGENGEHIGKIKLYTWKGPNFIQDPETDVAGVDWILAEDWLPYQRPSFVTPPFAGYISGHSTYSRAAAEILTYLTGDEFFPGGVGVFECERNDFLVFEDGPSETVELQWATYRDASDQCSLSRIWGGIHPPADDIPGRKIGIKISDDVIEKAETYFYVDADQDGFYNYQDCDDSNAMINPDAAEVCDGRDNDCVGGIDNDLPVNTYYLDVDNDGFGDFAFPIDTCLAFAPAEYVDNAMDCNDQLSDINPSIIEICDAIDNNCSGQADEGIPKNRYYLDLDNDGYGDINFPVDTCIMIPPVGFVDNPEDCNDEVSDINPDRIEVCDGIDNNCSGAADEGLTVSRYYFDFDNDGYGDETIFADTCITVPPAGYVLNPDDCNDEDAGINPEMVDIADNGIDEDCSGLDLYKASKVFPNPFSDQIEVHLDFNQDVTARIVDRLGRIITLRRGSFNDNFFTFQLRDIPSGIYYMQVLDVNNEELYTEKILKI